MLVLITNLTFAQEEGLKYKLGFILMPTKDNEYVNVSVEANIVVVDNTVCNTFFPDKTSLVSFVDDAICLVLNDILPNYTSDEIPVRLDEISKELSIKIETNRHELIPSKRGIKVEDIRLIIK